MYVIRSSKSLELNFSLFTENLLSISFLPYHQPNKIPKIYLGEIPKNISGLKIEVAIEKSKPKIINSFLNNSFYFEFYKLIIKIICNNPIMKPK